MRRGALIVLMAAVAAFVPAPARAQEAYVPEYQCPVAMLPTGGGEPCTVDLENGRHRIDVRTILAGQGSFALDVSYINGWTFFHAECAVTALPFSFRSSCSIWSSGYGFEGYSSSTLWVAVVVVDETGVIVNTPSGGFATLSTGPGVGAVVLTGHALP